MSLVATRIQNWRVKAPDFDKNMTRPSEYGALDLFVSQTDSGQSFVTEELKSKAMRSIGTTLQIPVINYDGDVTVSNARSCTIQDDENTSALYTVVFATYAVGFTMVPVLHHNNDIDYKHDFARKMEKSLRAMADALDTAAISTLEANKTQVFQDLLIYTQVGNVINIPWDYRTEIYGDLNVMMKANDYRGMLHMVTNAGIESNIRKLAQWGENNAVNKQLEYAGKAFHFTNNLVNEAGKFGTAFCVENGNVGYLTRSGRENLAGTNKNNTEWGIVNMPLLNIPVDTYFYTDKVDASGTAGESSADMTCVIKEYYGFMVDIAFLVSYNSNPDVVANPIMKLAIGTPPNNAVARPVQIVNDAKNPVITQTV